MDFTTLLSQSGDDLYKLALAYKLNHDADNFYNHLIMACNKDCQAAKDEFHDEYYEKLFTANIVGVSHDYTNRLQFLELTKQYAYSAFVLGEMYDRGTGVTQDFKMAKTLYEAAIKNRSCTFAMNNLAVLYKNGSGVDPDEKMVTKLTRAANHFKSPHAMYKQACRDYDSSLYKAAIKGLEDCIMLGYEKGVDKLVEVYKNKYLPRKLNNKQLVINYFIKLGKPEKLKDIYGYDDYSLYVMKQNSQLKKELADLELGLMMKALLNPPSNVLNAVPVTVN